MTSLQAIEAAVEQLENDVEADTAGSFEASGQS
jgi:outer membrane murein-binding lipoprotein Lpp